MEINEMIKKLENKDDKVAYAMLLELEKISEEKNVTYKYMDKFLDMLTDSKTYIRVRGFRLMCKNAKWDKKKIIDKNIDKILSVLDEYEKPTSERQYLIALKNVVIYKKELSEKIKEKLIKIDCFKYKESMQGLIIKDIDTLLEMM